MSAMAAAFRGRADIRQRLHTKRVAAESAQEHAWSWCGGVKKVTALTTGEVMQGRVCFGKFRGRILLTLVR